MVGGPHILHENETNSIGFGPDEHSWSSLWYVQFIGFMSTIWFSTSCWLCRLLGGAREKTEHEERKASGRWLLKWLTDWPSHSPSVVLSLDRWSSQARRSRKNEDWTYEAQKQIIDLPQIHDARQLLPSRKLRIVLYEKREPEKAFPSSQFSHRFHLIPPDAPTATFSADNCGSHSFISLCCRFPVSRSQFARAPSAVRAGEKIGLPT